MARVYVYIVCDRCDVKELTEIKVGYKDNQPVIFPEKPNGWGRYSYSNYRGPDTEEYFCPKHKQDHHE